MFFDNKDFFPTPDEVIERMLHGTDIENKTILEPSAGKGNIVDYLKLNGAAQVIACEKNEDLQKILASKCKVIASDFLTITGEMISHIDMIVMNPPFSADEKHILHAFEIAPAGCKIIALCNLETVKSRYRRDRERLGGIVEQYGNYEDLGACFSTAERKTGVEVALVIIDKPGVSSKNEFEGFFMDEDPEEVQENALMSYNVVRDLVNRYVGAVKIFDEQLSVAQRMDTMLGEIAAPSKGDRYDDVILTTFLATAESAPQLRNEFKKTLQKNAWKLIFNKMDMQKYATRGLKEDINKFVEQQQNIPFTMRNIYKMLEIVVGTQSQRMDKAILEVFDKLTTHYDENRYHVEGWKTNSHYLVNQKFIIPNMCWQDQRWNKGSDISTNYGSNFELIEDLLKALCYITGDNYDDFLSLDHFIRYEFKHQENGKYIGSDNQYAYADDKVKEYAKKGRKVWVKNYKPIYGELFDWGYFKVRCYKKGTMHFIFNDEKLWGQFNQRVAKLKGYPLYEYVKKEEKIKPEPVTTAGPAKTEVKGFKVLSTIKIKTA